MFLEQEAENIVVPEPMGTLVPRPSMGEVEKHQLAHVFHETWCEHNSRSPA